MSVVIVKVRHSAKLRLGLIKDSKPNYFITVPIKNKVTILILYVPEIITVLITNTIVILVTSICFIVILGSSIIAICVD